VADLRRVKDSYNGVEAAIVGKITGHISPIELLETWGRLAVQLGTSKAGLVQ
jgi:hypothetical protein